MCVSLWVFFYVCVFVCYSVCVFVCLRVFPFLFVGLLFERSRE